MEKEIRLQVEVESKKDFEKVKELVNVYVANLELSGILKVKELESVEEE